MWFEALTGFREESPKQVRENIVIDGGVLTSRINGKAYSCGLLEQVSLAELRSRVNNIEVNSGKLSVSEVIADVQELHIEKSNADSLFQVASQFNLLEMVSPNVSYP